ncbi:hypothetical protein N7457_003633 [Penicillium paradoxum]|uniref:uncharacterized protein n=1 Tax=Penicillium paradoxum TaxID=176176 RepID=UPI0025472E68|nr:uncharacterized protein N7457_003633 [Penicillium paradoxum]KAJ5788643.1 hypothetical protein N7457_003633 [Penicillium paradoxum]
MPKNNKEIEDQLLKALESLSKQSKPNIAKTTREFAEESRFFNDNLMVGSLILYRITTSYNASLNAILSTIYDDGELLILSELLHLTKLYREHP